MTAEPPSAFVAGRPVSPQTAAAAAARLLGGARLPLIAGLAADIAGARAAIALAERLRGVFDHVHSAAIFNTLTPMREAGMMLTTPGEVRLRADTVLLAGPGIAAAWPGIWEQLALRDAPRLASAPGRRAVYWIGARGESAPSDIGAVHVLPDAPPAHSLQTLRALARGTRLAGAGALDACAAALAGAKIGAAVWAQAALKALTTEMLYGLVFDLNAKTRFSGLPLAPAGNAAGVTMAAGWMTGFPPRTGFARGFPEHDPWLFDARRLAASGEADAVLWIDAMGEAAPDWTGPATVAITTAGARFATPPAVQFIAGTPGADHGGVLHDAATGSLVAFRAAQPSAKASVAAIIALIATALGGEALPC